MADQSDIEALAKAYLDLWQEHLSAASQDKDVAETMAKTMAMMNSGAATFANAMSKAANSSATSDAMQQDPETDHDAPPRTSVDASPSGRASSACLSSEHPDPVVAQLLERIAALEGRIAQLEQDQPDPHIGKIRKRK